MHIPKVSIIVPIYNVEQYLNQCVCSIRSQTEPDIEIILIDDGSPDACPDLCDQFAQQDSRIKVYHQKNAGVSVARNLGIQAARSEWIMFVDPDDWLEADAVRVLYNQAVTGDYDIVYGSYYWNYPNRQAAVWLDGENIQEYAGEQCFKFLFDHLLGAKKAKINVSAPWAKLYKKKTVEQEQCRFPVGQKKAQDYIFNLYAAQAAHKICIIDVPVYHYRIRHSSTSFKLQSDSQEAYRRCIAEIRKYMERYGHLPEFSLYFNITVIGKTFELAKLYGRNIDSIAALRLSARSILSLSREPDLAQAIADTRIQSVPNLKWKMALWFLKHRMYSILLLMCFLQSKLFPNKA